MFNIRFAEKKDAKTIFDFIKDLAEFEKLSYQVITSPELIDEKLFGAKKFAEVLLAEENNQVLGFAVFFHNYSTFLGKPGLYLEDLFVKPEARGKNIGKSLLKKLAAIAYERDCGRMEWTVLDWNTPAIKFYEQLGAKPVAGWTIFRLEQDKLRSLAES